tara:strand:+ start:1111 stop:1341 length:231 start_codon:yes stop_codon:yes gene_type:complete
MTNRYLSAEHLKSDDFMAPITGEPGEVVYDARVLGGTRWATMTQESFDLHGAGELGLGKGQKYVRNLDGELWKVEG